MLSREEIYGSPITTVCFTGHRRIPADKVREVSRNLESIMFDLYDRGARIFKTGGAVGFDAMAAQEVLNMKYRFGDGNVHLYLCLPAPSQDLKYSKEQREEYRYILERSDGVTYASDVCDTESYYARNRYLVKNSDVCVAYCTQRRGGTYYTCKQALLSGVEFINIADLMI